jgi:hypothetical protein
MEHARAKLLAHRFGDRLCLEVARIGEVGEVERRRLAVEMTNRKPNAAEISLRLAST